MGYFIHVNSITTGKTFHDNDAKNKRTNEEEIIMM